VLRYLTTQNDTDKEKLIKAAVAVVDEIKAIRRDHKKELAEAQAAFEIKLDDKISKADDAHRIVTLFLLSRKKRKRVHSFK